MILRLSITLIVFLLCNNVFSQSLEESANFWESKALNCKTSNGILFPSKPTGQTEPLQPCDDGDMTLFNGLLCAAGDNRGCIGVAEAQDPITGEWFRSPRIRLSGNDRGGSSFSPDMALGVQLYLVKTGDINRANLWLKWLHELVPCTLKPFGKCIFKGIPRFCSDDVKDKGCTMRPGAAAMLAATVNFLQKRYGLSNLPNGRLRGYLGTWSGYGKWFEETGSKLNKPGFSQHLVGVSVLLYKMMAETDPRLKSIATNLAEKNTGNAFYSYLAERPKQQVVQEILERCPKPDVPLKYPLRQWQWERENADKAWESSCYWDCIFMKKLISQTP